MGATGADGQRRISRIRAVVLATLVLGSACSVGVAVTGTTVAQNDASVGFDLNEETARDVEVGDPTVPWVIRMTGTDTVSLVLSGKDYENLSYWMNVTIRDSNDDGRVTVGINTFRVGHSNPWMVTGGEILSWEQQELPEGEIINKTLGSSAESYTIGLAAGDDPAVAVTDPAQEARLNVDDAESEGFDPATAPGEKEFETLSQIYQEADVFSDLAIGLSTEGDQVVADGDTLMFNPWGGGYYGMSLVAFDRTDTRELGFKWLLDRGFMHFVMKQSNAIDGSPKILNVSEAIAQDALEYDSSQAHGHVLISIRTDAEVFQVNGEGEFVEIEAGEVYRARFAKDKRVDPDVESNSTMFWADRNFSVVHPRVDIESPAATLQNDKIGGRTTLAPGTNFTVYVQIGADQDTLEEFQTKVKKTPGGHDTQIGTTPSAGYETHPWNFTANLGDVDRTQVRVAVTRPDGTLLKAFPRGWVPDTGDDTIRTTTVAPTTTSDDDNGAETTTTARTTTSTTTTAGGNGGEDGGDGGGDGGMIPGFTVSAALVALVAAALLARRRG